MRSNQLFFDRSKLNAGKFLSEVLDHHRPLTSTVGVRVDLRHVLNIACSAGRFALLALIGATFLKRASTATIVSGGIVPTRRVTGLLVLADNFG